MAEVRVEFQFGEWLETFAGVVATDAQPGSSNLKGMVIARIAMFADADHLRDAAAGKANPGVIHLSMMPRHAREFSSKLALAADLAEGRAPAATN